MRGVAGRCGPVASLLLVQELRAALSRPPPNQFGGSLWMHHRPTRCYHLPSPLCFCPSTKDWGALVATPPTLLPRPPGLQVCFCALPVVVQHLRRTGSHARHSVDTPYYGSNADHTMADQESAANTVDETPISPSRPNPARKNSLERHLAHRPGRQELVDRRHLVSWPWMAQG
jgi:hypothetical protein